MYDAPVTHSTRALPQSGAVQSALGLVVTTAFDEQDQQQTLVVESSVLVGTSEACDLQLHDPTISRRHLQVSPGEIGVRVVDLESRNGTWLSESRRLRDVELAPGERFRIGSTTLEVTTGESERSNPSAAEAHARFGRFVGESVVLQPLYQQLKRVSATDSTVLIEGESGTGKELLAEAIHEHSGRKDGPFVVVDCGALPADLMESEIFGHEAGAFTGAQKRRQGAFEAAHQGTVFLDEIGELPLQLQTRLLRVLAQRQVRRVGGSENVDVDVRVVAATNRNLDQEVEEERFRLDLFHRLAVVLLRVPPLRERRGDVPMLARRMLADMGADTALLTQEILDRLQRYHWPGNVRELRNYVERLSLLGDIGPDLDAGGSDDLSSIAQSGLPFRQVRARGLNLLTRVYVQDMLERHDGNVTHAAKAAGVDRRYFQRLKVRGEE